MLMAAFSCSDMWNKTMTRFLARLALCAALAVTMAGEAGAKAGGGGSFGSRGGRTYSAPPATSTAPRPAAPIERSATPQGQPSANQGLQRPATGGFFGGALGRGLMGGLLGAGLFGLFAGSGLFGGLGDLMSFVGLALQIGLLVLVVRFAFSFFRRRQPVAAGMGGGLGNGLAGMAGRGAAPPAPVQDAKLAIGPNDFSVFEQRLGEIQTAFGNEDVARLGTLATPEMASHFTGEIEQNVRKGVINKLGSVKLLQGDLSESWREANGEYASVAMRFGLIDATYDRATQRLVAGNDNVPQESTEVWTFRRPAGTGPGDWRLSAIQQA